MSSEDYKEVGVFLTLVGGSVAVVVAGFSSFLWVLSKICPLDGEPLSERRGKCWRCGDGLIRPLDGDARRSQARQSRLREMTDGELIGLMEDTALESRRRSHGL